MSGAILTSMHIVHAVDAVVMPWRNGGGSTREYLREPADDEDFDWRLSVAEVATDGPFSAFPGVDRILVLLAGNGMELRSAERSVVLGEPLQHLAFSGEAGIQAHLLDGPTTDLNLMWRRDRYRAVVATARGTGRLQLDAAGVSLAFVAAGSATVDGHTLAQGDVVQFTGHLAAWGDATLVLFDLVPRTP
jgi:environmental stress-induced protein Ves